MPLDEHGNEPGSPDYKGPAKDQGEAHAVKEIREKEEEEKHDDPPKADHHAELHTRVESLSARVDELSNTVNTLVSTGGQEQDSKPVKPAWIHRKIF